MRTILLILGQILVFAASQAVMYWWEGGIRVADSYADPPLSEVFHAKFSEPLAETSRRSLSHLDIIERWSYWRALRKFPTLERCLKSPNADDGRGFEFDWKAMRTTEQAQVCLHHISAKLKDPVLIRDWLKAQGYNVQIVIGTNNGFRAVSGDWDYSVNQRRDPFSFFSIWKIYSFDPFIAPGGVNIRITIDTRSGIPINISMRYETALI